MSAEYWEGAYRKESKIWGDQPSELAVAVDHFLTRSKRDLAGKRLLDVGCGYGRDTLFLSAHHPCIAVGIDPAQTAVAIAQQTAGSLGQTGVTFAQSTFEDWPEESYDAVFAANLYQILDKESRRRFRLKLPRLLAPDGLLFLGNHTAQDSELAGKGEPIADDPNSFFDKRLMHLCTREELEQDFSFLHILDLHEHEFWEPRTNGPDHHHITWILIAEAKQ
jgi:cyclopropane fatty-acyl-phospholipid synthase-like methyltransferase